MNYKVIEVNANGRVTFIVDLEPMSEAWIKAIESMKDDKIWEL